MRNYTPEKLQSNYNKFIEAIKKVFSGDFKGALEDVKSAGKESIDVLTGVNNTVDKATDFVSDAADAVKNYATDTLKAADANVKLAKSAELAAVINQGLIETAFRLRKDALFNQISDGINEIYLLTVQQIHG